MLLRAPPDPLSIQMLASLVSVRQYSERTLREVGLKALTESINIHTNTHIECWETDSGSPLGPLFSRALVEEGFKCWVSKSAQT